MGCMAPLWQAARTLFRTAQRDASLGPVCPEREERGLMAVVEGLSDGSLTALVKDPVEAHPALGGGPENELQELIDRRVDGKAARTRRK